MISLTFDIETTGTDISKDRIIEFAYIKHEDGKKIKEESFLVNPTIAIPEDSTKIHGITDKDVKNKPAFSHMVDRVKSIFEGVDVLIGYNVKFDIAFLQKELILNHTCIKFFNYKIIDPFLIFTRFHPRDLAGAYKFYLDKEHVNAHRSLTDSQVTYEILEAQIKKYSLDFDVPEVQAIATPKFPMCDVAKCFCFDEAGKIIFGFGKYKGQEVDPDQPYIRDYLSWMISRDFLPDAKNICKAIIKGFEISKENICEVITGRIW